MKIKKGCVILEDFVLNKNIHKLKVRWSQNEFMKSSIFQKMTRKIWSIFALRVFIEILQIFGVIFWKIDDSINPFWFNLTFSFFNLKWKKNVKKRFERLNCIFLETNKSLSPHEIVGIFVPFFAKSNERLYCFIDFLASLWSATNNGRCMT